MNAFELPKGYIALPAGYCYALLRVGLVLRNAEGREVYFQPGDDEAIIRRTIESLDECDDPRIAEICADVALSPYFD